MRIYARVTEPMMNGIGGDLFAIYYEAATHKLYGLNASGWTAKTLNVDFLKSHGIRSEIPSTSIHADREAIPQSPPWRLSK
jgi:gamma-glutamyltranspeptidase / glutathione hydrolase